jgi:hypothetical protein
VPSQNNSREKDQKKTTQKKTQKKNTQKNPRTGHGKRQTKPEHSQTLLEVRSTLDLVPPDLGIVNLGARVVAKRGEKDCRACRALFAALGGGQQGRDTGKPQEAQQERPSLVRKRHRPPRRQRVKLPFAQQMMLNKNKLKPNNKPKHTQKPAPPTALIDQTHRRRPRTRSKTTVR